MVSAFCIFAKTGAKISGCTATGFMIMYATIISLVYFAQMTTVRTCGLSEQAANIIDFLRFGLFFNYGML